MISYQTSLSGITVLLILNFVDRWLFFCHSFGQNVCFAANTLNFSAVLDNMTFNFFIRQKRKFFTEIINNHLIPNKCKCNNFSIEFSADVYASLIDKSFASQGTLSNALALIVSSIFLVRHKAWLFVMNREPMRTEITNLQQKKGASLAQKSFSSSAVET